MLHEFTGLIVSTWVSEFNGKKNNYVKFMVPKHGVRECQIVYKCTGVDFSNVPITQAHKFSLDVWSTQYEGKTYWQILAAEVSEENKK